MGKIIKPNIGSCRFIFHEFMPRNKAYCSEEAYAMVNDLFEQNVKLRADLERVRLNADKLTEYVLLFDKHFDISKLVNHQEDFYDWMITTAKKYLKTIEHINPEGSEK